MKIFVTLSLVCLSVSINAFNYSLNMDVVTNEQRLLYSIAFSSLAGTKTYLKRIKDQATPDVQKTVINNGLAYAKARVSWTDAWKSNLWEDLAAFLGGAFLGGIYFYPKKDTTNNMTKHIANTALTGAACVLLRQYWASRLFNNATNVENHLRKQLKKIS